MLLLIQKHIKNSVRIKAPNSVNASKGKHKNQINHFYKQRRVLMANYTVCQSKWKPIVEPRRAKPETFNSTSRCLDDFLNIDNLYFEGMISQSYLSEFKSNKANSTYTEVAFLDLH